jgi:hypothetical protein
VHRQVALLQQPLSPATSSVVPAASPTPHTLFPAHHFWCVVRTLTLATVYGATYSNPEGHRTPRTVLLGEKPWEARFNAPSSEGFSGGPVLDREDQVVGMLAGRSVRTNPLSMGSHDFGRIDTWVQEVPKSFDQLSVPAIRVGSSLLHTSATQPSRPPTPPPSLPILSPSSGRKPAT